MIRRLYFAHPFVVLVLLAALVATLAVATAATAQAVTEQRTRDAYCASIGEHWSDAAAECVGDGGQVA